MQFVVVYRRHCDRFSKIYRKYNKDEREKKTDLVVSRGKGSFLPIVQDRGTKRARSQRQVSGDPEIRNGCKRAP